MPFRPPAWYYCFSCNEPVAAPEHFLTGAHTGHAFSCARCDASKGYQNQNRLAKSHRSEREGSRRCKPAAAATNTTATSRWRASGAVGDDRYNGSATSPAMAPWEVVAADVVANTRRFATAVGACLRDVQTYIEGDVLLKHRDVRHRIDVLQAECRRLEEEVAGEGTTEAAVVRRGAALLDQGSALLKAIQNTRAFVSTSSSSSIRADQHQDQQQAAGLDSILRTMDACAEQITQTCADLKALDFYSQSAHQRQRHLLPSGEHSSASLRLPMDVFLHSPTGGVNDSYSPLYPMRVEENLGAPPLTAVLSTREAFQEALHRAEEAIQNKKNRKSERDSHHHRHVAATTTASVVGTDRPPGAAAATSIPTSPQVYLSKAPLPPRQKRDPSPIVELSPLTESTSSRSSESSGDDDDYSTDSSCNDERCISRRDHWQTRAHAPRHSPRRHRGPSPAKRGETRSKKGALLSGSQSQQPTYPTYALPRRDATLKRQLCDTFAALERLLRGAEDDRHYAEGHDDQRRGLRLTLDPLVHSHAAAVRGLLQECRRVGDDKLYDWGVHHQTLRAYARQFS